MASLNLAAWELAQIDTPVTVALVTAGGMLLAAALGFFFKAITGENRAGVRRTMTEAMGNDAGASNSYMEAARKAAQMMTELQVQIATLSARVDALEDERLELQREIAELQAENKKLRGLLDERSGKLPLRY
jgi:hypothetical protein